MRRLATPAAAMLAVALFAGVAWTGLARPTVPRDEPLWLERARILPTDWSEPLYRHWAVDIPAMNRWLWGAVLAATGQWSPAGEESCWQLSDDGRQFLFEGRRVGQMQRTPPLTAREFGHIVGPTAPRIAVVTMRATNLLCFAVALAALAWTARMALGRWAPAALCTLPVMLAPTLGDQIAWQSTSGDMLMIMWAALALAAWMRFHLRGDGTSNRALAVVAALLGASVASKHCGLLPLIGFCAYAAATERGWKRLGAPLAVCGVAFVVFAALNPVIFLSRAEAPWTVCWQMAVRRKAVVAGMVAARGALAWSAIVGSGFFWWPLLPIVGAVAWRARREAWFWPLAAWAGALGGGMLLGITCTRAAYPAYYAPIHLAVFYGAAIVLLARPTVARWLP